MLMARAGKPEAPYNCTLTNQTTESLSVECTAGFDGGQPQHFLLEVFDQHTRVLQANVTSRENAAFTVQGLEPGKVLNMILYAVNAKGRSEPTLLEGFTLKVAEKQTGKLCQKYSLSPRSAEDMKIDKTFAPFANTITSSDELITSL